MASPPAAPERIAPRDEYTRRLDRRRTALADATRRHLTTGNLRLATVAAVSVTAYLAIGREWFAVWWVLVPVAAFFWAGAKLERAVQERARLDRAVAFYEAGLARLDGRWVGQGTDSGERFLDDTHLYARDLDLFGHGSLFELLNVARTRLGQATLAAWLGAPATPGVIRDRQDAVRDLAPRVDLREDLAVLGEDARSGVHADALAAWGQQPARLPSARRPVWLWPFSVAGALAAACLLVLFATWLGAYQLEPRTAAVLRVYAVLLLAVGGAVLWRYRARVDGILHDASEAAHDLDLLSGILGRLEAERFTSARLTTLRAELDIDGDPPSHRIAKLDGLMSLVDSREHVLLRLLRPLVLWDIHLIYAIERWRRTSGPSLQRWLSAVGEIEALASLAAFSFEHPDDVFPEVTEGPACFEGEGLGHPLISEREMVTNDVRLTGPLRVIVISGSNMSGKSTLLRTVGANAVLAQAGGAVRARRLRMSPLQPGASIRVSDSLLGGVSRFYAEITRVGAIVQGANRRPPVLFLIDELLHGTNSHDRRIGAEAIVRSLVGRGAIGLVTTHDLALAHVADALGDGGANMHFEDDLADGRMHFDYHLRPGVVQKSNALALIRSVGVDV